MAQPTLAASHPAATASAPSVPQAARHLQAFAWNDPATWRNFLDAAGSFAVNLLVAILILAGGAWAILPGLFARSADETFASVGARVGEEASVEHRNFSGRPQADRKE